MYVDEDYYEYFKDPESPHQPRPGPKFDSKLEYYLNPDSSQNVYKEFKKG